MLLSITRWNLHEKYHGRVIHKVERMGVPLLFVMEMDAPVDVDGQPGQTPGH